MAMITRFKSGDVIFNVSHSVGKFGRNLKGDVQLVQFLLNKIIEGSSQKAVSKMTGRKKVFRHPSC
jgi:hypothetical protein